MANRDYSIDPRILESAGREFLEKGFEKTSLKEICSKAGITTGALYKRYKGKEELFCAVVEEAVEDLYGLIESRQAVVPEQLSDEDLIRSWEMRREDLLWWFQHLYKWHDEFVMLLTCAEGTRYANFQHDWVAKMTEATMRHLREVQKRGLCRKDVGERELHILLSSFWTTIYEPFIHGFSWEEIEQHCDLVCGWCNWHKALEFQIPQKCS